MRSALARRLRAFFAGVALAAFLLPATQARASFSCDEPEEAKRQPADKPFCDALDRFWGTRTCPDSPAGSFEVEICNATKAVLVPELGRPLCQSVRCAQLVQQIKAGIRAQAIPCSVQAPDED